MNRIVYEDFYKQYKYKCQDTFRNNTVVLPYIKAEDQNCDSAHSIDYKKYKQIVSSYLDNCCESLMQGHKVNLGSRLGTIEIQKIPSKSGVDWERYHKTGERKPHKNRHLGGYKPILIWNKSRFKMSRMWNIRLTKTQYHKLLKRLNKNMNLILKYSTA